MYWKAVASCFTQSDQKRLAENLRAITAVAPEKSAPPMAITPPAE